MKLGNNFHNWKTFAKFRAKGCFQQRYLPLDLMKNFLCLLLCLLPSFALRANMASPIIWGSGTGLPFISEYVTVKHESIRIVPSKDFKTCRFKVAYDIFADSSGIRIPMLFVATGYEGGMRITVDGIPVELAKVPEAAFIHNNSPKSRFLDARDGYKFYEVEIAWGDEDRRNYNLEDLHYFEFDFAAGAHQIKVEYEATVWRDRGNVVAEEYFVYTLSPAKYWKSFGALDITLEASDLPFPVETNLGKPVMGDLSGETKWHFDSLPAMDVIQISSKPEVGSTGKFFISMGQGGFMNAAWGILAVIHLIGIWAWRRKHFQKWFSWVWLVGSILIPLIACIVYVASESWIDNAIGPAASRFGSYSFLIIIFYPVYLILHGAVMLLMDFLIRRYRLKKA
jgi:hypothetical protein